MNNINNSFEPNNNNNQNLGQNANHQVYGNTNDPNINQNINQNNNDNTNNQNQNNGMSKVGKIILIVSIVVGVIITTGISYFIGKEMSSYRSRGQLDKPIIYLYPEEQTEVTVKLGKPENIICSYPKYDDGWTVIANPNGTLIDKDTNRELYSLYWEGEYNYQMPTNEGFVVKGEDSIAFLEEKLAVLGLNERETEEFIVYWLPKLENNEYNYIRFIETEEMNEIMPLEFSVEPDSVIRVFMQFKEVDKNYIVKEQVLETPERKGFVAVEWGGTEIE